MKMQMKRETLVYYIKADSCRVRTIVEKQPYIKKNIKD